MRSFTAEELKSFYVTIRTYDYDHPAKAESFIKIFAKTKDGVVYEVINFRGDTVDVFDIVVDTAVFTYEKYHGSIETKVFRRVNNITDKTLRNMSNQLIPYLFGKTENRKSKAFNIKALKFITGKTLTESQLSEIAEMGIREEMYSTMLNTNTAIYKI